MCATPVVVHLTEGVAEYVVSDDSRPGAETRAAVCVFVLVESENRARSAPRICCRFRPDSPRTCARPVLATQQEPGYPPLSILNGAVTSRVQQVLSRAASVS